MTIIDFQTKLRDFNVFTGNKKLRLSVTIVNICNKFNSHIARKVKLKQEARDLHVTSNHLTSYCIRFI